VLALGPRIVLAIGWLLFCGGYSGWAGVVQDDWLVAAVGGAVLLASFAALFRRSWSQWVIYAFVLYSGGVWFYYIWLGIRSGSFPLQSAQQTALSLVPGLAIIAASVWSADIVRRRLRKSPEQA